MSNWTRANTDWFHNARWGVFLHYLADTASAGKPADLTAQEWNDRVDSFNVNRLAGYLEEMNAGYLMVTLGQNSGFYCTPNTTYDSFVHESPSRLSKRDLVAELATALERLGIPLMVYLPCLAPANHPPALEGLCCTPPDLELALRLGLHPEIYTVQSDADMRLSEFHRRWQAVIREWSLRWGNKVRGWWLDGCYAPDQLYRHDDTPNFRSFAEALKSGNPDALITFNPGVRNPVISITDYEDYTAGEISNTLPTNGEAPCVVPVGRWVDGAQYHILSFLGGVWGSGAPRFPGDLATAYTRYVNGWGGVVSWDVPVTGDGDIPEEFRRLLEAIGATLRS
ncbi:MAG: hypothetical protein AUJ92_04225 [Armatimonadetes bacterium CG2_30_59_28]|nr:hypothetical protein [Armatimonadota bacterium]OIO97125.1 MAG: hypothetical protein AUJ92_04225 [Armatimonadetes bacterium CG2_30_59_28]PIU65794.1 MAG: hypothetical protein COS85_07330 [Armatimonadetes bacterium CG07_land_8_20_14_0_80_59_28]PIX42582.1 MAG: hypothetical protein COZ56_09040 [Armatimonadetes bacterium CG_4_8_14_3_um_filter_58_9]PIY40329.1 MAG: hypothetical protein COZ05_17670 [Armatimonadetes bacterium CG_4_10_14_3_um_filter_59_10]